MVPETRRISVNEIRLDEANPRIAEVLSQQVEINAEVIKIALGVGRGSAGKNEGTTYVSLEESIRANGGIINPIIIRKENNSGYVAIEGNTRLQIYKDFLEKGVPGDWETIPAIVYSSIEQIDIDRIRLQAHLVGPRPWEPYAKARYLYQLSEIEHIPLSDLVPFCGGRAGEVAEMIGAFKDFEKYYKPLVQSRGEAPNRMKFSAFKEMQNKVRKDALIRANYSMVDFARWVADENIDTMAGTRSLPAVLADDEARQVFLKTNITEARKVLSAKELRGHDNLDRLSIETLASALSKKLRNFPAEEILRLRDDIDSVKQREILYGLSENLSMVLDLVEGV